MLVLFEERDGRADLAGGAVAALEAVVLEEGGLHGVEVTRVSAWARPSMVVISEPRRRRRRG